jgi:hypothetical protein
MHGIMLFAESSMHSMGYDRPTQHRTERDVLSFGDSRCGTIWLCAKQKSGLVKTQNTDQGKRRFLGRA